MLEVDGEPVNDSSLLDVVKVPYATATGYQSKEGPVRPGRVRIKMTFPEASQVWFFIGLHRAGWLGAVAAAIGFTLPSALLMYAFAVFAPQLPAIDAILHGLKLVAVAVVAQAVWNMANKLCPDRRRAGIALAAAALLLVMGGASMQFVVLAFGAAAGFFLFGAGSPRPRAPRRRLPALTPRWLAFLARRFTIRCGLQPFNPGPMSRSR